MNQIAQEGAIQMFFEPNSGMERVIVGVVGVLQFEVLEYRLKHEYGVDIIRRPMPQQYIRWIENKNIVPTSLTLDTDTKWVQDYRGNNLLIFPREWSIRWALEKNKDLVLKEFHEG